MSPQLRRSTRKTIILAIIVLFAAFVFPAIVVPIGGFFILQTESIVRSGTWEEDPKNWSRAFGEKPPAEIKVIHSNYGRSNHFTVEFAYFFEVQASPQWRDAFLKERGVQLVSPASAHSFRENFHFDMTPNWFAPDPVDQYEVWEKSGRSGSIWINKSTGNIHFYDIQL